ncbi:MAG: hypothetical protein ABI321_18510 [Polyangia bacterium]
MIRAGLGVLALGLVLLPSHQSAASDAERLVFLGCDALLRDKDVRARLRIERSQDRGAMGTDDAPVVTVSCAAETVRLSTGGGEALSKTIDLHDDDPDVRARVVALAIVELCAAAAGEPVARPTPAVVHEAVAHGPIGTRLRIEAVASTQVFFVGRRALFGGGLRVGEDRWRHFGWTLDVLEHHGAAATALGKVAIDDVTLGAAAVAHREGARVGVRGGLGMRIGATLLRGQPASGDAVHGGRVTWAAGGPFATLGVHVRPVRSLVIELATEAGYWIFPTGGLVNGQRALAVEGPWLGVQLGLGIIL